MVGGARPRLSSETEESAQKEQDCAAMHKLYDPELMPNDLKLAHEELDNFIEHIYAQACKSKSKDHLSLLLKIYSKLTGGKNV